MKKVIYYFKSKEFILSMFILLTMTFVNILSGLISTNRIEGVNCFSFWNYSLHYGIGSAVMFLSPIIIAYISLTDFYYKFFGSYLKNAMLRKKYFKIFFKELFLSYIKAWVPFAIISLISFIFAYMKFPHNIITTYASQYTMFKYEGLTNPYIFIALSFVQTFLYVIMITNISLIILYLTKKLMVSYIITLVATNAINIIVGNVLIFIGESIGNEKFLNYIHNVNVFEGYFVQSNMINAILHTSIYVFITFITVIAIYRKKEKLVILNEVV